jgi:hypothetical protein
LSEYILAIPAIQKSRKKARVKRIDVIRFSDEVFSNPIAASTRPTNDRGSIMKCNSG